MIERSQDYRRIKKLDNLDLIISSSAFYLVEVVNGHDMGVWAFIPHEQGLIIHAAMGRHKGAKAAASVRCAFEWVFENTDCDTIFAEIPRDKRHAHFMASHVGMKFDRVDDGLRCYHFSRDDLSEMRKAA